MVLIGVVLVYLFIHNLPPDLGPIDERLGTPLRPGHVVHGAQELREPTGPPQPTEADDNEGDKGRHYYNGPIKFYRLATSLHGISRTQGSRLFNRNVLFAASSLKSVANLMPMACDMGRWERNYVHLAIFGRDTLPLEEILDINGVSHKSCTVYFHDARGDYSEYSTDVRMVASIKGAMKHINDFMHPQVIIMDDSILEDDFFTHAMRTKAKELRQPLIEVPDGRYEDWLWMTRLDSGSLGNWFKPTIDLVINAPRDSSGGLIRLIKSLEKADYTGLKAPKLTIELPSDVEYFVKNYLRDLEWPPDEKASPLRMNGLVVRRRIPSSRVTSEQASLRFLESFYPTSTQDNHVLILSPQVEISPLFLQYLHYVILEYKYSSYEMTDTENLLGISLDVPASFINGSAGFITPTMAAIDAEKMKKNGELDESSPAPFLYQAPSSTASLIFGDKWTTLHNFLTNRLAASHTGKAERSHKIVSETEPAWLEYLLELMRARGWSMLHPSTPLVAVHNELARIPEEYTREQSDTKTDPEVPRPPHDLVEEPFLTAPDPPTIQEHTEHDPHNGLMPLQDILPFDGDLPELPHLPYLYHTGDAISRETMREFRDTYAPNFRRHIGGCEGQDADRNRKLYALSTDDLFCLADRDPEYDEEKEEEEKEAEVAEAIVKATEPEPPAENADSGEESTPDESAGNTEKKEPEKATVETKEEIRAQEEASGR